MYQAPEASSLQHNVKLLKPYETFSVFGAFLIFRLLALDDEQSLQVTGSYNKTTEKSSVLLPPPLPKFRTQKCRNPGMTIEIKMEIIKADEVSVTNIS